MLHDWDYRGRKWPGRLGNLKTHLDCDGKNTAPLTVQIYCFMHSDVLSCWCHKHAERKRPQSPVGGGFVSCTVCVLCGFFSPILTASLPNRDGASCKSLYKFSSDPVMDTQESWVDKAENRRLCVLRDRGGLKKEKKCICLNLTGITVYPSPPVREWLISVREPGTRGPSALGSNSCRGQAEVMRTAWEIMAETLPDTLCAPPCYRKSAFDQSHWESSSSGPDWAPSGGYCTTPASWAKSARERRVWFMSQTRELEKCPVHLWL